MYTMQKIIQQKIPLSIATLQQYLTSLYKKPNIKRKFEDYYAYLDRTAGYLCKAIYKQFGVGGYQQHNNIERHEIEGKFIRPLSWLFTMSSHLRIEVEKAFLRRYPGICPYCLQGECVCFKTKQQPLKPLPPYQMQEEMQFRFETIRNTTSPITIDWAVDNITKIYGVNEIIWYYAGPWHHISKIHEEIAEIHEAYTRYRRGEIRLSAVEDEIADVFAWILGSWRIIFPNESLADAFKTYYMNECPVCHSFPCQCKRFAGRPEGLLDYKQLATVRDALVDLTRQLPALQNDLEDIISSLDTALNTQNEPIARTTITQLNTKLQQIQEFVHTSENISASTLSTLSNIVRIVTLLSRYF